MARNKHRDLQPWLDYFQMLHTYEQKGFLEVKADKHEAYVTRAALLTLVPEVVSSFKVQVSGVPTDSDAAAQLETLNLKLETCVSALRTYAAYLAAHQRGVQDFVPQTLADPAATLPPIPEKELTAYLAQNFALHVVHDDPPHDPLLTLLLSLKNRHVGRKTDHIEVISYVEEKEDNV